ncbi:MAG TPA: alpha/beta hydrolase [Chloroflexota bacterium]|nr:alpha/beta hydrolase [Chloroflexota bacterium]HZU06872.1 alpha/beta hydrolase [Chloroflexota bacterium]
MAAQARRVRLWQGKIETEVLVQGSGPPLVFLHGPWGLRADTDFLARLAQTHTVYAPRHPGTSPSDPDAIYQLDNWWDLVIYYGELFDCLELRAPAIVGHSFGGMVACELAATMPERVSKLVLIAPLGLWHEERPVKNWMILPEHECRRALFADPEGEAASRFFGLPDDPEARVEARVSFIWSQACTGKFVWPIPDKGLKKHIHRIAAPTLIVWGEEDGLIAPAYADEFAHRIATARRELIARAGHLPHLEQPEAVVSLVRGFLSA